MSNAAHNYSFFGKNRGLGMSIVLPILVCLWSYLIDIEPTQNISSIFWLTFLYVVFVSTHVAWDYKIRKSFVSCSVVDGSLVLYFPSGLKVIPIKDIDKLEEFPVADDIYDDDCVAHMMSSGVRIMYGQEKFLIFKKISNYSELLGEIKHNQGSRPA